MARLGAFVGRLLLASLFLLSGAMKVASFPQVQPSPLPQRLTNLHHQLLQQVAQHDEATGGPIVAYMSPKVDLLLSKVYNLTGVRLPLEKVRQRGLLLRLLHPILAASNSKHLLTTAHMAACSAAGHVSCHRAGSGLPGTAGWSAVHRQRAAGCCAAGEHAIAGQTAG